MVAPPQSGNSARSVPKSKTTKKSTFRVITEILIVLFFVEMYFYRKLSLNEYQELEPLYDNHSQESANEMATLEAPHTHILKQKQKQAKANNPPRRKKTLKELKEAELKLKQERQKRKRDEQDFVLTHDDGDGDGDDNAKMDPQLREERLKTAERLKHMGVSGDFKLSELPPWSQIVENFNSYSHDDEPVILGLEYCAAFRDRTDPKRIGVGPAGLFSTGTNLITQLTRYNCMGPLNRTGMLDKFALVQVPYGKHNPADARFHHQVKAPKVPDREAILPVVAIRHPYTWMSAMCHVSYQTRWKHNKGKCHESLYLENPIVGVPWGFKKYNETHNVTNTYQSLAHMWKDWYKPYFLDTKYNQTPRLMIRHEDIVYRPEKVLQKICECVGGTNRNPNPDWGSPNGFEYEEESANKGMGHGRTGRSGLLTAVIKYGQPIRNWYEQYSGTDRKIMKEAFQGETDPILRTIFETFQYRLFDDVGEPTKAERMRANKRAFLERREKESRLKELREKEAETKKINEAKEKRKTEFIQRGAK